MPKILVVDDDATVRAMCVEVLKQVGHTCITAEDSWSAWSQLREQSFDAVLSDIDMNGENDGLRLVMQMHQRGVELPIILMSGRPNRLLDEHALKKLGVKAILAKPFRIEQLTQAVDQATQPRKDQMTR